MPTTEHINFCSNHQRLTHETLGALTNYTIKLKANLGAINGHLQTINDLDEIRQRRSVTNSEQP